MKRIILAAALCLFSLESMSIGRPHNVFAAHRAVNARTTQKQSIKVQTKPITQVIDNAKAAVEDTKQVVSVVRLLASIFEGI